jgi:hypothetical protein
MQQLMPSLVDHDRYPQSVDPKDIIFHGIPMGLLRKLTGLFYLSDDRCNEKSASRQDCYSPGKRLPRERG